MALSSNMLELVAIWDRAGAPEPSSDYLTDESPTAARTRLYTGLRLRWD